MDAGTTGVEPVTPQQSYALCGAGLYDVNPAIQRDRLRPLIYPTPFVGDTGFEPVTSTMSTWRSNQLS